MNNLMKKIIIGGLICSNGLSLNSCVTTSYSRKLENIVKQSHQTISLPQKQIRQYRLEDNQIPFSYSQTQLSISKDRKINIETYNSEKAFSNIILLPTLGEPANSLDEFSKAMASYGHNLFALDVEGFGKSTGTRGEINIPKIKQDISKTIEYIKSQNNKEIVLAGTSIGSEFSLIYLADGKYKHEINSAVFHGLVGPYLEISHADYRLMFLQTDIGACLTNFFSGGELNMFYHLGKENFYNNEQKTEEILRNPDYTINKIDTKSYTKFLHYRLKNPLDSYKGKILFIISKDDQMIPFKHSINVYSCLKNKNLNITLYIPQGKDSNNEVPHMAFDTNFKEITQTINYFLRGTQNSN